MNLAHTYTVEASKPFINVYGDTVITWTVLCYCNGEFTDRFACGNEKQANRVGQDWCDRHNAPTLDFSGCTEAVMVTYTGHDGFPDEPVAEYIPMVYASTAYGDRKACYLGPSVRDCEAAQARADRCAKALAARASLGKLPVGFHTGAHWFTARPVYGSDAYVAYGQADDLEWEARMDADEAWN